LGGRGGASNKGGGVGDPARVKNVKRKPQKKGARNLNANGG